MKTNYLRTANCCKFCEHGEKNKNEMLVTCNTGFGTVLITSTCNKFKKREK